MRTKLFVFLITVMLSACGGGGGSSSGDNSDDSNTSDGNGSNTSNQAPSAVSDNATLDKGSSATIDVLANDSDADGSLDTASVTVTSSPANGTVSVDSTNGAVTYTPNQGFVGEDTLSYTVADQQGATSNPATVTLTVDTVDGAPRSIVSEISLPETGKLKSFAISESDSNTMVAATAPTTVGQEGTGLFRSTDGGQAWTLVLPGKAPERLVSGPKGIFLTTGPGTKDDADYPTLRFSDDSGESWSSKAIRDTSFGDVISSTDLEIDPQNPKEWWLVSDDAIGGGIYRSLDSGSTWGKRLPNDSPMVFLRDIKVPEGSANEVFVATWAGDTRSVMKSVDNGDTFSASTLGISTSALESIREIEISKNGDVGIVYNHITVNGGANWSSSDVYPRNMVFRNGRIWAVRDGKLEISEDNAQTWQTLRDSGMPNGSGVDSEIWSNGDYLIVREETSVYKIDISAYL